LRTARVVLLFIAAGLLCVCAHAQEPAWSASVGFVGDARGDCWVPLWLEATNAGAAREGKLAIPLRSSHDDRLLLSHTLGFDLPTASAKAYGLCVYADTGSAPYMLLPTPTGQKPTKKEINQTVDGQDSLLVIVGGGPSYLSHLDGTLAPGVAQAAGVGDVPTLEVAHIPWERLPDTWLAWDSVDAVMLGDAAVDTASDASLEALLEWVKLGGMLIVPGGTHSPALGTSALAPVLPLSVSGTATATQLDGLRAWSDKPIARQPTVVAGGALREGARVSGSRSSVRCRWAPGAW